MKNKLTIKEDAMASAMVSVSDWKFDRKLIEDLEAKKIMLEIALAHDHCPTCAKRVRHVTQMMSKRNVQYSWAYPDGAKSFLVLDHPGPNVQLTGYLSDLLELRIRR